MRKRAYKDGQTTRRSFYKEYLERVVAYHQTKASKKGHPKRKCGLSLYLARASSSMACDGFGYRGCEGELQKRDDHFHTMEASAMI
jgi:hypothetical protein